MFTQDSTIPYSAKTADILSAVRKASFCIVLLPPMADKIIDKIPDNVKEVAIEETNRIKELTTHAARSGAYLYPLRVCFQTGLHHRHDS